MDILKNATCIRIDLNDLADLVNEKTSNPIAEVTIPDMLREAIKREIPVILTTCDGDSCRIILDNGNYRLVSI